MSPMAPTMQMCSVLRSYLLLEKVLIRKISLPGTSGLISDIKGWKISGEIKSMVLGVAFTAIGVPWGT